MKILVTRVYNTYNIGSAMMAINLICYLNKEIKNAEFYTDIKDDKNLDRLKKSTNMEKLKIEEVQVPEYYNKIVRAIRKFTPNIFNKCIFDKDIEKYANYINLKYDLIIILGGDDLAAGYPINEIRRQLQTIKKLSDKCKIILFGHTIGPFDKELSNEFKSYLRNTCIYPRDKSTYDYVDKYIKPKKLNLTTDLAFLDLPFQNERKNEILKKYNIYNEKYITLIPSGLYKYYIEDIDIYVHEWSKIIESILENKKYKDFKIVLLSHVQAPLEVDDSVVINRLYLKLNNTKNIIKICDREILPYEAREILGCGEFTITGRMHGAISTFQMKKPAISISYSVKYKGVIGEGLGFNDLIIESSPEKWKLKMISKEVVEMIEYLEKNYQSINERIEKNVNDSISCVSKNIKSIANEVND